MRDHPITSVALPPEGRLAFMNRCLSFFIAPLFLVFLGVFDVFILKRTTGGRFKRIDIPTPAFGRFLEHIGKDRFLPIGPDVDGAIDRDVSLPVNLGSQRGSDLNI